MGCKYIEFDFLGQSKWGANIKIIFAPRSRYLYLVAQILKNYGRSNNYIPADGKLWTRLCVFNPLRSTLGCKYKVCIFFAKIRGGTEQTWCKYIDVDFLREKNGVQI